MTLTRMTHDGNELWDLDAIGMDSDNMLHALSFSDLLQMHKEIGEVIQRKVDHVKMESIVECSLDFTRVRRGL